MLPLALAPTELGSLRDNYVSGAIRLLNHANISRNLSHSLLPNPTKTPIHVGQQSFPAFGSGSAAVIETQNMRHWCAQIFDNPASWFRPLPTPLSLLFSNLHIPSAADRGHFCFLFCCSVSH